MGNVLALAGLRSERGLAVPQRTRARLSWKPSDIQDALYAADGGDLSIAAELCERVMADDRVAGVLATRTLGMLGLPMTLLGDEQQVAALTGAGGVDDETDGDWSRMHPDSESAQVIAWGIVLGVGLAQRVPLPRRAGERALHTIRAWHPRWLRWEYLDYRDERAVAGESGHWVLYTAQGRREIAPGDGEWILYTPYGEERPWAHGVWRALAFAWILKQFALLDRSRHLEVLGSPVRVGIAPEGASEEKRVEWQRKLEQLSRDSAIVLPTGYDLRLVEATSNSWELYTQQISWADSATATAIAGQAITTEGASGFGDGKTQDSIRRELVRFTSKTWASTLRSQSLLPWAEANFGAANAPLPQWDAESSEERLARARSLISLGEAIARLDAAYAASGVRVDTGALAQRYDIPLVPLPDSSQAPTIALAPTDVAKVVRVNEARASAGLGPLKTREGAEDDAGWLMVAELEAAQKRAAEAQDDAGDGSESARAEQQREMDQAVSP